MSTPEQTLGILKRSKRANCVHRLVGLSLHLMSAELTKLSALAAQLPRGLQADWRLTNHYELHAPEGPESYFWWELGEVQDPHEGDTQSTVAGQRLGLLMDIAEEVARLRDLGLLPNTMMSHARTEPHTRHE